MIKEYSEGMVEDNGKKKKESNIDKTLNCLKDFGITLLIYIFSFFSATLCFLLFYVHTL